MKVKVSPELTQLLAAQEPDPSKAVLIRLLRSAELVGDRNPVAEPTRYGGKSSEVGGLDRVQFTRD